MDAPPSVEASMVGASPCGGAPAMDASTDGGASIVDASLFFFKKSHCKYKNRGEKKGEVSGGGTAVVA